MSEIILRPATVDDAAEMLAIYAPYVIQTTVSSEYDAPTLEEFTRRIRTFTEKLPWLVCIIDGEVAGYGYASPHRTRAAYQWSVETSIYVAQDWHRHGIAGAIYAALFEVLAMQGYYNIYVGITSPNERSMKFHKASLDTYCFRIRTTRYSLLRTLVLEELTAYERENRATLDAPRAATETAAERDKVARRVP